jgi:predicted nuclease with TOPRIM domain
LASTSNECKELQKRLTIVENEKAQLDKKCQKSQQIIRKLQTEFDEEKQMNKMLTEGKQTLMTRNAELERLRVTVIICGIAFSHAYF